MRAATLTALLLVFACSKKDEAAKIEPAQSPPVAAEPTEPAPSGDKEIEKSGEGDYRAAAEKVLAFAGAAQAVAEAHKRDCDQTAKDLAAVNEKYTGDIAAAQSALGAPTADDGLDWYYTKEVLALANSSVGALAASCKSKAMASAVEVFRKMAAAPPKPPDPPWMSKEADEAITQIVAWLNDVAAVAAKGKENDCKGMGARLAPRADKGRLLAEKMQKTVASLKSNPEATEWLDRSLAESQDKVARAIGTCSTDPALAPVVSAMAALAPH